MPGRKMVSGTKNPKTKQSVTKKITQQEVINDQLAAALKSDRYLVLVSYVSNGRTLVKRIGHLPWTGCRSCSISSQVS